MMIIPEAVKCGFIPTYYPECERKNILRRIGENLLWALKYKEANHFYTLYGLDLEIAPKNDVYMDYRGFMNSRNRLNRPTNPESQVGILRDKLMFYRYLTQVGIETPEVFALMLNGKLYDIQMNPADKADFLKDRKDYFLKDFTGECASFVKHVRDYEEYQNLKLEEKGGYILQKKIFQCAQMERMNPGAINTLRMVTVNRDGKPFVLSTVLRVGTKETGNVDNWAAGGISIGVDDTGKLRKYGYYKEPCRGKTDQHPDSNVVFETFHIPKWNECVGEVCEAHKYFYSVPFIGWDVAVTEKGPIIIEGNDNWEISLIQASNEPLRNSWMKLI